MQRQVWLIPIADERVGVPVKLWNPLRTRAIPECFCGGDSPRRGTISSVCTFTFTFTTFCYYYDYFLILFYYFLLLLVLLELPCTSSTTATSSFFNHCYLFLLVVGWVSTLDHKLTPVFLVLRHFSDFW